MECSVHTVSAAAPLVLSLPARSCAEDAVLAACKRLGVAPIARPLFALRSRGSRLFLPDAAEVQPRGVYELRIRFKVPKLRHLRSLDETTYDYYFRQARDDVVENTVPEIQYEQHKNELLGLGITDMYRAIQEDNVSLRDVERRYKKYIPKEIIRKHQIFAKKPVHTTLQQWCQKTPRQDPNYVKECYLQQLLMMAPNYLSEEYAVRWDTGCGEYAPARVQVIPYHQTQPGLRLFNELDKEWVHICTMEQLCFLGRRPIKPELEVCRKNGVPVYLRFASREEIASFISACDGYYRLMVKWTFNLSKDDPTPSLERLYAMKCHGPVGGEFSYHKLSDKRSKKHGCFILRECQHDYDVYYIDACTKNSTTETYKVEYKYLEARVKESPFAGMCYVFNSDEGRPYASVEHLVRSFGDPDQRVYLKECLPPSEYDKSQLLLCGEQHKVGVRVDQAQLQELLKQQRTPRCINTRDIQIYKGSQVVGAEGVTATFKAIWKLEENKKMEVALKTLVREKCDTHLKDFIELASKWAGVQSSSVVRMYGVTLISPSALVMEYLQYGPLDVYLSSNSERVEAVQLMTAAAGLARALWDLSEAGCVHGRLRCSKVLLAHHDRDKFTVKLSDPGLHTYTEDDIHWIPIELYGDLSLARKSVAADVWAFGTTLWEIFSYGLAPTQTNPVMRQKGYEQGHRLACPSKCPRDVWTVILDCWLADPHRRAIPQVIMRDISHLLHREFIPTNDHYERVDPEVGAYVGNGAETVATDIMFRATCEPDNTSDTSRVTADSSLSFPSTGVITFPEHEASTESLYQYESYSVCEPDVHNMQWVVGLGPNCRVTTQQRIGSGFYGEVYRGVLERDDQVQARQVAIKRLKGNGDGNIVHDFLMEIQVMKTLEHPNIVEIVGVCEERELLIVMEYVEHGALSSYLKFNKHRLTHRHLLKYAQDVASGMEYLSAKHLVHRDLAARNILVQDERHVKISDFGLARVTADNDKYRMKTLRDLPLNWYAPEATLGEFSHASDVWSYGVTLWEMFTYGADVPTFDLKRAASRAQCFTIPEDCPSEVYRRLMSPCWHYEPSERPSFLALVHLCKQLLLQY